ncbi:hypothetical protein [Chitinilyticum piscinae]|uniref:Uncharacterized protein n=1 Tax=Chitinilyticum piscinae TaxID=2866724 RepID=A0A8J7KGX6_9NEIS|nr:hypothetical protein [Chitinilyticum piscinae]MBE9610839.1 hypothetical protein [Chitinilyticum piscinae]
MHSPNHPHPQIVSTTLALRALSLDAFLEEQWLLDWEEHAYLAAQDAALEAHLEEQLLQDREEYAYLAAQDAALEAHLEEQLLQDWEEHAYLAAQDTALEVHLEEQLLRNWQEHANQTEQEILHPHNQKYEIVAAPEDENPEWQEQWQDAQSDMDDYSRSEEEGWFYADEDGHDKS